MSDHQREILASRYEVIRLLGAGGTGRVLLVRDRFAEGRLLAFKELTTGRDDDLEQLAALAREYRVLTHLRHPHLVEVVDFALAPHPHLTMEYVDGVPLIDAELGEDELVDVVVQICRALDYIHARGLVHLDLKPTNILVARGAGGIRAKLVDFGVAADRETREVSGFTVGYVAPEVAQGRPYDGRADLYALGCTLIALVRRGQTPMSGDADTVLGPIIVEADADVEGYAAQLPGALTAIVPRLVRHDPAERWATASQVIEELGRASGRPFPTETAATRAVHLEPTRLVGRGAVLAALAGERARVRAGAAAGLQLVGPSGGGKSALLRELRTLAQLAGEHVALADGGGGVLRALGTIVTALIGAALDLELPVRRELARLAPALMDEGQPLAPEPVVDNEAARGRLRAAFLTLVQRATAERPVILLVEDADDLDADSAGALAAAAELPRVLVVLAARTPVERFPGAMLAVPPLEPTDIDELASELVGPGVLPARFLARVAERAAGRGVYVTELAKLLAELGLLERTPDSRWQTSARGLAELAMPDDPEAIAAWRMRLLPERLRRAVRLAGLLGRRFDPRVVREVLDGDGGELAELVERRFLVADGRELVFEHRATFAAARAEGGQAPEAGGLRRRLGLALARRRGSPEAVAALLEASDRPGLAVDALLEVARAREAVFDFRGAVQALDRALALGLRPSRADTTGGARATAGHIHVARLTAIRRGGLGDVPLEREAALASASASGQALAARLELGALALQRSDFAAALVETQVVLTLTAAPAELAQARRLSALARYGRGELAQAVAELDAGLAALEPEGERRAELRARLLTDRGFVHAYAGDFERAIADHQGALELLRGVRGDALAAALSNLGFAEWQLGRLGDARRHLTEALDLRRRLGDVYGAAVTTNNLGNVFRHAGAAAEAERAYRDAIELARRSGSRLYEAIALNNLGQLFENEGRFAEALQLYGRALGMVRELGDKIREGDNLANLGACQLEVGELGDAVDHLGRAVSLRRGLGDQAYLVLDLSFLARALLAAGRREEAAAAIDEATAALARGQKGVEAPQVVWANAVRVYAGLDRTAAAAAAKERGRAEVLRQADAIDDPALRRSFLTKVRVNRELMR